MPDEAPVTRARGRASRSVSVMAASSGDRVVPYGLGVLPARRPSHAVPARRDRTSGWDRERMLRRIDVDKVLRLTGAATVAYVVAVLLTDASLAILAPLTALLVVQVTLVGIVRSSIDRVLAV